MLSAESSPRATQASARICHDFSSPSDGSGHLCAAPICLASSTVCGPAGAAFSVVWAGAVPRQPASASNKSAPNAARARHEGVCILIPFPACDTHSPDRRDP